MKIISVALLFVASICLTMLILKVELIGGSINVGWDVTENALAQLKSEINSIKDEEILRDIALTNADLDSRSTKHMARYIVYFYASLMVIVFLLVTCAVFIWRSSNKYSQQDAAKNAAPLL